MNRRPEARAHRSGARMLQGRAEAEAAHTAAPAEVATPEGAAAESESAREAGGAAMPVPRRGAQRRGGAQRRSEADPCRTATGRGGMQWRTQQGL